MYINNLCCNFFYTFDTVSLFILCYVLILINQINTNIYIYSFMSINYFLFFVYLFSYYLGYQQIIFFLILAEVPIILFLILLILDFKFYFFKKFINNNIYIYIFLLFPVSLYIFFNFDYTNYYEDYISLDYSDIHNNDLFGLYISMYLSEPYFIYFISILFIILTIFLNYFFYFYKNYKRSFSLKKFFNFISVKFNVSFTFIKNNFDYYINLISEKYYKIYFFSKNKIL